MRESRIGRKKQDGEAGGRNRSEKKQIQEGRMVKQEGEA